MLKQIFWVMFGLGTFLVLKEQHKVGAVKLNKVVFLSFSNHFFTARGLSFYRSTLERVAMVNSL